MPKDKVTLASIVSAIEEAIEGEDWLSTIGGVECADKKGIFDDEFGRLAIAVMKKELVRRALRRRGADDWPLFANIVTTDPKTGLSQHLYMREKHMRPPQYKQASEYWVKQDRHAVTMANGWIERCNVRYHTQLKLPFPGVVQDSE